MSRNATPIPRRSPGQVVERQRKTGTFYGLRVRAGGARHYIGLGAEADGWTRERAELELAYVLERLERGEWTPPERSPAVAPAPADPTFHAFASEWFDSRRHELRAKTIEDYTWRLSNHLLPYFAKHRLSQITAQEVDRYRAAKLRAGELSPRSINMTLTLLAAILETAVDYGLLAANTAKGRKRRARETRPRRSYLDTAEQIAALLDAAGELDSRAAVGHRHIRRRAMLATLTFAGLRLGELLALRWRDADLAAGRLRITDAKTAAGVRDVRLRPALRDELAALKANGNPRPDELVFATTTRKAVGASNLRRRVLAPAIKLANERLTKAGAAPLPAGLTPHSLRRTFASVLYALGETPPVVMAEMGHTTPHLALAIYAQVMSRDAGQVEELRALVNGTDWAPAGHPGDSEAPAALSTDSAVS
jgi:integrase